MSTPGSGGSCRTCRCGTGSLSASCSKTVRNSDHLGGVAEKVLLCRTAMRCSLPPPTTPDQSLPPAGLQHSVAVHVADVGYVGNDGPRSGAPGTFLSCVAGQLRQHVRGGLHAHGRLGLPQLPQTVPEAARHVLLSRRQGPHGERASLSPKTRYSRK